MASNALPRWIPSNLPRERTSFVGRRGDLERVRAAFAEGATLVTLTGPGGAGKTRLARRYAMDLTAEAAPAVGGVWFCDLTDARTAEELAERIASVLDVPLARDATLAQAALQIRHALGARQPLLMILDDFERLVDFGPETIGAWTAHLSAARFLVTSRRRLRLEGEVEVEVGPLEEADALALYAARAKSSDPSFRLEGDEGAARALVRRLDYGALAIELAAARVKVLPPQQLCARLSARLDLLRSPQRDAPERHASLRAAIDRSWELLSEEERRALALLSVFESSFSIEAADAVLTEAAGAASRGLDLLESLTEHSLVARDADRAEGPVFRLSETIQAYASEKLSELDRSERARAMERHAVFFVDALGRKTEPLVAPWGGAPEPDPTMEIEGCRVIARRPPSNVFRAVAALRLDAATRGRGPTAQLRSVVLEALADAEALPGEVRARLGTVHADLLRLHGDLASAEEQVNDVLARVRGSGSVEAVLASMVKVEIELDRGALAEALHSATEALEASRAGADARLEALCMHTLARVHVDTDDVAAARVMCERALPIARDRGLAAVESGVLKMLGIVAARSGDLDEAERRYGECIAIARRTGDAYLELTASLNLADVRARRGDTELALAGFREVVAMAVVAGFRRAHGVAANHVGLALHEQGRLREAREAHEEGLAIHREMGNVRSEAYALEVVGVLAIEEGRPSEAASTLERAVELARAHGLSAVLAGSSAALAVTLADPSQRDARAHALDEAARAAEHLDRVETTRLVSLLGALADVVAGEPGAGARGRALLSSPNAGEGRSARCRIARRLLEAVLEGHRPSIPEGALPTSPAGDAVLEIASDGRWFQRAGGPRVDLSTRRSMRLMLLALATQRVERPEAALTLEQLFEAGWPGERIAQTAAFRRVYTAIGSLRDMGLRDVLVRRDDGYRLAETVPVAFEKL